MTKTTEIRQVAIDHHDAMAGAFENYYSDLEQSRFSNAFTYGRAKLDRMVDDLFSSLPAGASILDVGCGTGEHLKRALGHGLKAYGVEPAPSMLEVARRNVPQAVIESGVATRLPFPDNSFDALIQIEVLRYLDMADIRLALEESARVLKPGGTLFVTLVNRWALDGFYVLQRARQFGKKSAFDNANPYCEFFTPGRAKAELQRAGLGDVRIEGRLFAPLRIVYKVSSGLGQRLSQMLEGVDDRVHRWRWTRRFAGHLIAIGRKQ